MEFEDERIYSSLLRSLGQLPGAPLSDSPTLAESEWRGLLMTYYSLWKKASRRG
jgi:hypothetical protein